MADELEVDQPWWLVRREKEELLDRARKLEAGGEPVRGYQPTPWWGLPPYVIEWRRPTKEEAFRDFWHLVIPEVLDLVRSGQHTVDDETLLFMTDYVKSYTVAVPAIKPTRSRWVDVGEKEERGFSRTLEKYLQAKQAEP